MDDSSLLARNTFTKQSFTSLAKTTRLLQIEIRNLQVKWNNDCPVSPLLNNSSLTPVGPDASQEDHKGGDSVFRSFQSINSPIRRVSSVGSDGSLRSLMNLMSSGAGAESASRSYRGKATTCRVYFPLQNEDPFHSYRKTALMNHALDVEASLEEGPAYAATNMKYIHNFTLGSQDETLQIRSLVCSKGISRYNKLMDRWMDVCIYGCITYIWMDACKYVCICVTSGWG